MNKTEIRELLERHGITGVVSTRIIARVLSLSGKTINEAKNCGKLKQIDRNTYDLDSIVNWLHGNQRYLVRLVENQFQQKRTI